ncbi:MAG: DUF4434 domain-containing protein [Bacteroides sp.]|nr:DUF4434 domain-containing protein [Bacteroides sp.]
MKKNIFTLLMSVLLLSQVACTSAPTEQQDTALQTSGLVKPITGTWINLAYQDVRNKYTNPQQFDNTDPQMWAQKVAELKEMGVEYLVFMAVANEEKAYYPSKLMEWTYPADRKSPVDAIMDKAAELGMKVFMSTGWAKDQDDNLRDPAIKQRQLDMMKELAVLYGTHPALYGWYLPVEDCLCPLLSEHAVVAVNALTDQARSLTPGKKILISPYGIVDSDFANPEYEKQLAKLKVDIIAYQDEVGCVREQFPMPRLKQSWQKLRDIHNRLDIAMWANCETFTWERATNDRTSALIPAAYPRLLSQQVAASAAGVENIISFMLCGIFENPDSPYQLGQPVWSARAYEDYMDWQQGSRYWKLLEASLLEKLKNQADASMLEAAYTALADGAVAEETTQDECWVKFAAGCHEVLVDMQQTTAVDEVMMRLLNYRLGGVTLPGKVYLWTSDDAGQWQLVAIKDAPYWPNSNHDAWIDTVLFTDLGIEARYLKVVFDTEGELYMDELYVNPKIG